VTAGIILAAGESRRMGFPKALLRYQGETFVDAIAGLFARHCSQVIVVLGAHAERIRAGVARPVEFVYNPDYAKGMTTSFQCGLRAVRPEAESVLFTLVDHPAVSPETIDALVAGSGPLLRVPRFQFRRGHPIWFSRDLIPEFLAIPEYGAARDVVRSHAAATEFIDVDDPGVIADIDDAAAYRKLVEASV
jgi:molybdenum cofactor cytidylyltransferase